MCILFMLMATNLIWTIWAHLLVTTPSLFMVTHHVRGIFEFHFFGPSWCSKAFHAETSPKVWRWSHFKGHKGPRPRLIFVLALCSLCRLRKNTMFDSLTLMVHVFFCSCGSGFMPTHTHGVEADRLWSSNLIFLSATRTLQRRLEVSLGSMLVGAPCKRTSYWMMPP